MSAVGWALKPEHRSWALAGLKTCGGDKNSLGDQFMDNRNTASSVWFLWVLAALSVHCMSPPGFAKQILAVQGQWRGDTCFSDR